jgi:predicted  nucleic acid-binding Zn-ribbon protein
MIWISQKKISVKVSINSKTGKEIYKKIPDGYKRRKNDDVQSIWVQEKRHCLMCGPDLVLEWGVDNQRASRIDNPKKDSIFVVGIRRNNNLSSLQMRSAAYKLLQLQDFASECLFELRLAMRRNNGRVLVYDAAQVPKQFLKTGGYQNAINRVMHHAKKDQFLIINSADKQSRYNFNQFTSLDLSTKGLMQDIFSMLGLIEELAGKFLGLSPQREGNIDQYESATGTERAVSQSTARTEIYVKPFESFIKYVLDKVLIKGKYTYEENETAQYIFGDLKTMFFKIYPEYFQEDVGAYIADNFAEQKKKSVIDSAAQQALSNAATPDLILSLIETLNADTAGESEAIFKRAVKAMNKLKEQESQAIAAAQESAQKATADLKAEEISLKREEFQNNIDVAMIKSDGDALKNLNSISSNEKIKVADIEKDLLLSETKTNNK